jgi:hypothetical protein
MLEFQGKMSRSPPGQKWRSTDQGWIKINIDGAIDGLEMKGEEAGLLVPTSFLGAWSKPYMGVTDSLISEVLALRDGVIFAKFCGFSHVVMEMDSLEVVNL